MADLGWDDRYSKEWKSGKVQAIAHQKTGGRCCYCLSRESTEIHHALYKTPFGLVKHMERASIGTALFPVCDRCHHGILHDKKHWRYDNSDPVFGSGNDPETISKLRFGYKLLEMSNYRQFALK